MRSPNSARAVTASSVSPGSASRSINATDQRALPELADGDDGRPRHLDILVVEQRPQLALEQVGQHGDQPRRLEPRALAGLARSSTIFDSSSRAASTFCVGPAARETRPAPRGSRSPGSRRAASMRSSGSICVERGEIQQRLGAHLQARIVSSRSTSGFTVTSPARASSASAWRAHLRRLVLQQRREPPDAPSGRAPSRTGCSA